MAQNQSAPGTVAVAQRQQLVQPGSDKPRTIQGLLAHPDTVKKFQQVAPRHLSPDRLLRVMAHAVYKVPKLGECEPITLLGAMMACASLGLEPNTPLGHAYLIPFEQRRYNREARKYETEKVDVQLIIGYRGFIDLARRSGSLVSLHADVVYEGDEFSFEYGTKMHLRHVPKGAREGRRPLWAYAHASLSDGQAFEVLPYEEVLKIRDNTQGYQAAVKAKKEAEEEQGKQWRMKSYLAAPWVAHEHEMGAKTMIRRISKMLPMSIEFANAAALDAMSEGGRVDFAAFADGGQALIDVEVAERDEAPADEGAADQSTGGEQQQSSEPPAEQQQPQQQQKAQPKKTAEKKPEQRAEPPAEEQSQPAEQQQPQQQQPQQQPQQPAAGKAAPPKQLFKE